MEAGILDYGSQNTFFTKFFYGVIASITVLIGAYDKMDRTRDMFQDKHRDLRGDTFDFIIVGGGSSGAVVANRLSEKYKVLLLERGGDPYPWTFIPALTQYMLNHEEIDWMHRTVPQKKACLALDKKQARICQSKGLGGTSNLSYMNYVRGSPFDYNKWANITEDERWNYENMLPYFKRQEEYEGRWKNVEFHGFEGDMRMETPNYTGLAEQFVDAGIELGYHNVDLNGWFTEGFDYITAPIKRGYRQATYQAFLHHARHRHKFVIRKFANVTKILINASDKTAFGVQYDRHGKTKQAFATREVIISAGALQSPKLLMLSGIGPKKHLKASGIEAIVDAPAVGKGLQDHLSTFLGPFFVKFNMSFLMDRDLTGESVAAFGYGIGKGPMTSTGVHANGFFASSIAKTAKEAHWADTQLILYGMSHHDKFDKDFSSIYHLDRNISAQYFNDSMGKDSFTMIVSLGRPASRGEVLLNITDPNGPLIIDPNYLKEKNDMQIMIDGVHKSLDLVERTKPFKDINAKFTEEVFPGCEEYEFRSKAYWRCYIRHFTVSSSNVAGTCAMGLKESGKAVVDSELRVYGVKRLRVIDASVMPTIVVGGTEAASIVIGEKGADFIRNFWDSKDKNRS